MRNVMQLSFFIFEGSHFKLIDITEIFFKTYVSSDKADSTEQPLIITDMAFIDWLITKYFKQEAEIIVHLGPVPAAGSLCVILPLKQFWKKELFFKKATSILTKRWTPKQEKVAQVVSETFIVEVFGSHDDYGDKLYRNIVWYYHRQWKTDQLTKIDIEKAEAIDAMTLATRIRLGSNFIPLLSLQLGKLMPEICGLTHMMLVKVPVFSFQFFLDIDYRFTVHSIRKADHPQADDLISYLYDILFVQQKIAVSLHEYLLKVHVIDRFKKESVLTDANMDMILHAEQAITSIKSSIEKTVLFIGHIFGIAGLDGIPNHKKKLIKLIPAIPEKAKKNPYFELIAEFISSEKLEVLNNLRSGILHKRGIGNLQPHNHYGTDKGTDSLKELFLTLHTEHIKNTSVLLCTLAILTDVLVDLDPPEITPIELLFETNETFNDAITELYQQLQKESN